MFATIRRLLLEMVAAGTGSLTDRDEHGCTLLHVRVLYQAYVVWNPLTSRRKLRVFSTLA